MSANAQLRTFAGSSIVATMMMRTGLLALALGVSAAQPKPVPARVCPADAKLAGLLAASDLVLVGRMDVQKQRLVDEAHKPSPKYLDIPVQVEGVVKGSSISNVTVRFYPQDAAYKPTNEAVLGLAGQPAMLFLTHVDDGPAGLYFAGYTRDALKRATDLTVAAARAEASRQARILASWHADPTLPRFAEVQALIAELSLVSCPLLSGPSTMTVWTKEGTMNACEEAQARGDHREAA